MNIAELVATHIPREFVDEAIHVVETHAPLRGTTDDRRASAVDSLQVRLHVPEHRARLLVELAVFALKLLRAQSAPPDTADGR